MPVYELDFDDACSDYVLIGIHTVLKNYKLAYLLNKTLNTSFEKADYSLDIKSKIDDVKTSFSIYEYVNAGCNYFLIDNVSKYHVKTDTVGLFTQSEIIDYLIPEKKKVDYFLKIEGEFEQIYLNDWIENIKQISQIITSYQIEVDSLKSKDFLIF